MMKRTSHVTRDGKCAPTHNSCSASGLDRIKREWSRFDTGNPKCVILAYSSSLINGSMPIEILL